jgi:predicted dehydrogenase/threonine dehydrogenase-like Zn-dependent dehydrogenase
MKQIFRTNNGIKLNQVALPTPGEKDILVAIHASVISTGTETMNMHKGESTITQILKEKVELGKKVSQYFKENGLVVTLDAIKSKLNPNDQEVLFQPIGYSNSGIIVAKGMHVTEFNVGDHVACAGSGIAAHAEYTSIPVNLAVEIPKKLDFIHAGFTTIGAIAMQGIRRANVSFGETILITGLGLIGLLAVQIAKAWGLVVIGTDLNQERLELAKKYGADICINAEDLGFIDKVKAFTNGHGVDSVIIYAATPSSVPANQALESCRRRGRVVVVGAIGMELKRDNMYMKELDFVMSTSYGPGRYDDLYEFRGVDYPIGYVRWTENRNMQEFVRLLNCGLVKVDELISNVYSIENVDEAYRSLIETPGKNISSAFIYEHKLNESQPKKNELFLKTISKDKIGVGIIGAGSFVQRNHLKNILDQSNDYELIAIANKTPASSKLVAEKYNTQYETTDYQELLKDKSIDLIIIGTRHNLHAQQVIDSIYAGKHVLVEKPLAINYEELIQIESAIKEHPELTITVGFNRRYSQTVQSVMHMLNTHNGPRIINYRVNAGYFSPDIWIQKLDEGGGRIIGEACHFIDLIAYIADSEVKSVGAIHIPLEGSIQAEDNVIVSIAFQNGSIGVLTYAAIGGKDMEKERIEIFSRGQSFVISDFKELLCYNTKEKSFKLKDVDKGHKDLIIELSKKLKGHTSLIKPFSTDIEMSRLTLDVLNIIHSS